MRVVFFINNNFCSEKIRENAIRWAREYGSALQCEGINIEYFNPFETKITKSDLTHIFGFSNRENWYWLKKLSNKIVISPLPEEVIIFSRQLRLIHKLRFLKNRTTVLDDYLFIRSIDRIFDFGKILPAKIARHFKPSQIEILTQDPISAAKEMSKTYAKIFS